MPLPQPKLVVPTLTLKFLTNTFDKPTFKLPFTAKIEADGAPISKDWCAKTKVTMRVVNVTGRKSWRTGGKTIASGITPPVKFVRGACRILYSPKVKRLNSAARGSKLRFEIQVVVNRKVPGPNGPVKPAFNDKFLLRVG